MSELERFKNVVAKLRDPETGCPWDKVQTMMSLRRYLIEEAGEYLDALEAGDFDAVKDEMGDLLMQVVLNCRIAEEEGKFTLEDVAKSEADKMIRRHPHVFQGVELKTEQDRIDSWDKIKKSEKDDGRRSALDGVARSMPGLARAQKVLDKAGRVGFEWADFNGAMAKVARIADRMPAVPAWAKPSMFSVVAFAAMAAALSKPHTGCMLIPWALLLTRAATNRVNTHTTSSVDRIVCTKAAFCTPMMFRYPNRIRMPPASSISPR